MRQKKPKNGAPKEKCGKEINEREKVRRMKK